MEAEERRLALRCLTVLGVLGSGSLVGVAFSLYLVNHAPLLLVALSPLGRHFVLAAPLVDPVALVGVGAARRMLFYLAAFYLGRALGPAGIPWLEQRAARFARLVRWLERLFARAPHLVVLLFSGPTVSGLAGIAGMKTGLFVALALPGLVLRLLLVVGFAEWMREPIETLLAVIDEHWVPGTVLLVTLVAIHQWRRRRQFLRARAEL